MSPAHASCLVFRARVSSFPLSTPPNWTQVCEIRSQQVCVKFRRQQVERRDLKRRRECTRRWCTVLHLERERLSFFFNYTLFIGFVLWFQVSDPVAAEFSLNTQMILLSKRMLWLSDGSMGFGQESDTAFSQGKRNIQYKSHAKKQQQSKRKEFLNLNQGLWILFITQLLGLLSLFLSKEFTAWWMLLFSIFPIISQYKRRKKSALKN